MDARREMSELLGRPVAEVARTAWGFRARTDIVSFADGEQAVVQRFADPADARRRVDASRSLYEPAAGVGIRLARVLDEQPAWVAFERLPGEPVPALAGGLSDPRFPGLAEQMGELLRRWQTLPASAVAPGAWSEHDHLARAARRWLTAYGGDESEQRLIVRTIDALPSLFAGREPVVTHGDFAPLNVLTDGATLTALIDLEFVRLADPLFDVAWWLWTVGHAPAEVLATAAPRFLQGAGLDAEAPLFAERIDALQTLHMLELLATGDLEAGIHRGLSSMLRGRASA